MDINNLSFVYFSKVLQKDSEWLDFDHLLSLLTQDGEEVELDVVGRKSTFPKGGNGNLMKKIQCTN